ncbi:MAG: hypothetical protein V4660_17670 [Pseudomonadota bacterium]
MFGFGNKENYEERIKLAIERTQLRKAEVIAREAFSDSKADEHILAWVAAAMFEGDISSAFDLLEHFVQRFPDSLHLPRVYLADLFSRESLFDEATDYSRYYLRLAKESEVFSELATNKFIQDGVSRSFLLLTSAYTTLGARSYSKRILEHGLQYDLKDSWKKLIGEEYTQLENELKMLEHQDMDNKWELFFSTGAGSTELYKKCSTEGFPKMAKRIDLLETNFRFNKSFKVDAAEAFLIVLESENKEFVFG